jgi:hypothetical protein
MPFYGKDLSNQDLAVCKYPGTNPLRILRDDYPCTYVFLVSHLVSRVKISMSGTEEG